MTKKNMLVTICARAGSKGLKNKNILMLDGKPLIAHTIGQALKWGKADHIVVSTDSFEIADIAKKYKAEVPFMRSARLSGDSTPKIPVIKDALLRSEKYFKQIFDIVVDLDATAPIRSINDLDNCLKLYMKMKPDSIFSVVKADKNPYFNMVEKNGQGFARLSKSLPNNITRRQDAPDVYGMNASIYFYNRKYLMHRNTTSAVSKRSVAYEMDELSSYDIDNLKDFKYLEFLIKERLVEL